MSRDNNFAYQDSNAQNKRTVNIVVKNRPIKLP